MDILINSMEPLVSDTESNTSALKTGNNAITNFLRTLIFQSLLENNLSLEKLAHHYHALRVLKFI